MKQHGSYATVRNVLSRFASSAPQLTSHVSETELVARANRILAA